MIENKSGLPILLTSVSIKAIESGIININPESSFGMR